LRLLEALDEVGAPAAGEEEGERGEDEGQEASGRPGRRGGARGDMVWRMLYEKRRTSAIEVVKRTSAQTFTESDRTTGGLPLEGVPA
jgi:hypothetical protein